MRKWILSTFLLPEKGQKIYYFSENVGIFRGTYEYDSSSKGNPHKFISKHGILDRDDVSYWMPYDHSLRDMIPLPPFFLS